MRGQKLRLCVAFLLLLLLAGAAPNSAPKTSTIITNPIIREQRFRRNLVKRWAPIHLQDVDPTGADSLGGKADYLAAVDFDGDWRTDNNWEHAEHFPLRAVVYYSLLATRTHWFIVYAFYHPRDWSDAPNSELRRIESHENDMEGVLTVIKRPTTRNTSSFGELQALITVCHNDFYSYTPQG